MQVASKKRKHSKVSLEVGSGQGEPQNSVLGTVTKPGSQRKTFLKRFIKDTLADVEGRQMKLSKLKRKCVAASQKEYDGEELELSALFDVALEQLKPKVEINGKASLQ